MDNKTKLFDRLSGLRGMGYDPVYIAVYGSQNYKMDIYTNEYKSDFDTKAIIVPNLADLCSCAKPVSRVEEFKEGDCDVKDIRIFFNTLVKCNPAYIETFITDDYGTSEFYSFFYRLRSLITGLVWEQRDSFIRSTYGMIMEKYAALKHPYPNCLEQLEKYGYSPKQLHHMLRLYKMLKDFNKTGEIILVPNNTEELIGIKLGGLSEPEATALADETAKKAKELREQMLEEAKSEEHKDIFKETFISYSQKIIEEKIRMELR